MSRMMRDAGFVLLLLALAASLSWFFSKVRKEGVESYLALLGNQLFATVPEGADKDELKKKYDQFLVEVADRKIPPEQVEKVAASILNASNASEALTAQQVEAVLALAALPEGGLEKELSIVQVLPPEAPKVPARAGQDSLPRPPETRVGVFENTPEAWAALNERLKNLYEFNHKLHGALVAPEMPRMHMEYRFEPGMKMRLIVDDSLKHEIMRRNDAALTREWQRLEQKKLVVAQQNFATHLRSEQARLQQELQRLRALQRQTQPVPEKNSQAWQALEALKDLPAIVTVVAADSVIIRREIAKALKMAALADSLSGREDIKDALREASKALQETAAQQPGKNK